ncbi:hypothetical protein [Streptomyces sp. NPDC006879]|uniref:hypothetical protein n=1 Tax=Streptomyces sp. NPDC006879 TaxID=3364767 RepID=UPI00368EBA03
MDEEDHGAQTHAPHETRACGLRRYLREESIGPLPIRRPAVAHPEAADVVFRKLLRKPGFTWSWHDVALLRRRKP